MAKAARLLIEHLSVPEWGIPFRTDQMHLMGLESADDWHGCVYMTALLFQVVSDGMTRKAKREIPNVTDERAQQWGDAAARAMFGKWGRIPTPREQQHWRNQRLLDRHDAMKPEPNVMRLVREVIEENKLLPAEEQHAATGTDPVQLDQHIRRLLRNRRRAPRPTEAAE